jgi:hypothetical protein
MRGKFAQHQAMTVFAGFALISALWGERPQDNRMQNTQLQAVRENQASAPVYSAPRGPEGPVAHSGFGSRAADLRAIRPIGGMRAGSVQLVPSASPGTNLVVPPAWKRCTMMPDASYWGRRDIVAEIQWLSRRGAIPVTPLGDGVEALSDYSQQPAGWRAYGIAVPAGGSVQVEVQHIKLGWFRIMLVDQWGTPGPGMLQASIAHQPVMVTYRNPNKEATAIYIVVDDPAWWSDSRYPYTLLVRRDWDPAKVDLSKVQMVVGLWGTSPSVSAEFRRPTLTGPAVYPH